jgi:hypothetical protein
VSPEDQLKRVIEQVYSGGKGLEHIVKDLISPDDGAKKPKAKAIPIADWNQQKNTTSSIETLVNTMIEQAAT